MSCSNTNSKYCGPPTKIKRKGDYRKNCYNLNESFKFKVIFKDSCNNNYDPDDLSIQLNLTAPNGDLISPRDYIKVDTGFYYTEHTFLQEGSWSGFWSSEKDGIVREEPTFTFTVQNNLSSENIISGLSFNSLIVIELDKAIESEDGTKTLKENEFYSFSSEYNPFYCSVEMLRMEMGSWTDLVSDDTLALAIHWSSLEANNITGVPPTSERYLFARTRFVMYDAAIKLFSMPTGISSPGSGKSKTLGDLMIENGSSLDFALKDLVSELKAERDEWWRVVNAGGCIVPGQGLGPSSAVQGGARSDKMQRSREWHDPWTEYYIQPTQNSLYRKPGEKKYKHGYSGWTEYYYGQNVVNVRKGRR
jgi:hypothetical protein